MRSSRKKSNRRIGLAAILLFLIQLVLAVSYYHNITSSMEQQIKNNLEGECDEARENLQTRISAKTEWIKMVADVAGLSENAAAQTQERWLSLIQQYKHEEEYRIGIADNQGRLYFGKGEVRNIRNSPTYQEIMQGNAVVSPIIKGAFDGKDSIIIGAPIIGENGSAVGAMEIEYTTLELGSNINTENLHGMGYNMVVDSKGKVVASHPGMEKYETLFDMLKDREMCKGYSIDTARDNIENGKEGIIEYYFEDDHRMLYYKPADISDWNVISVISVNAYSDLILEARQRTTFFMLLSLLLTGSGILIITKLLYEKIRDLHQAGIDELTGVYTRAEGIQLLNLRFESSAIKCFGCMFMDLDHFKKINDEYGHEEGDRILAFVGDVIRSSIRVQDIAYHFGGDEFCVWLFGNGAEKEIKMIAQRIMEDLKNDDKDLHFSIGATVVSEMETDKEMILKRADEALYQAKKEGRNRIVFSK